MDVVRALGYPQSSTSVLLKGLHGFGYLNYDRKRRVYLPSTRVALLGARIQRGFFFSGDLAKLAYDLHEQTREEIIFSMQNGMYVQYIHTMEASNAMPAHHRSGALRPICKTASGKMLLSLKDDNEIGALVRRINASSVPRVHLPALIAEIGAIRETGVAICHEEATPGTSGIAMLMPELPNHPPMTIGVAGRTERIRTECDTLIASVREAVLNFGGHSAGGTGSTRKKESKHGHAAS